MTRVECARCHGTGTTYCSWSEHAQLCDGCDGMGWIEADAAPLGRLLVALLAMMAVIALVLVSLPDRAEGQGTYPELWWGTDNALYLSGPWAGLAACESGWFEEASGQWVIDPTIYNRGGSGAAGAFQFMPSTWAGVAAQIGRPDLAWLDPARVDIWTQAMMAHALAYRVNGGGLWHWSCSHRFGSAPTVVRVLGYQRAVEVVCRARWCTTPQSVPPDRLVCRARWCTA